MSFRWVISWLSSLRGREVSETRCVAGRHRTLESSLNRAPPDCYPLGVSGSSTHNALQINKKRSAVERVMNLAGKPPSLCTMHNLHLQLNSTELDLCLLFNGGREKNNQTSLLFWWMRCRVLLQCLLQSSFLISSNVFNVTLQFTSSPTDVRDRCELPEM